MGYSSDSERPVKRFKSSQPFTHPPAVVRHGGPQPISTTPDLALPDGVFIPLSSQRDPIVGATAGPSPIDNSWSWLSPPGGFPVELSYGIPPNESQESWGIPLPPPSLASPGPGLSSTVTSPSLRPDGISEVLHTGFPPQGMVPLPNAGAIPINSHLPPKDKAWPLPRASEDRRISSPFRDCLDTFGTFETQYIARPPEGFVNGYIKFAWSKDPQQGPVNTEEHPNGEMSGMELSIPASSTTTVSPGLGMATFTTPTPASLNTNLKIKAEASPSPTNLSDLSPVGLDYSGINFPKFESQTPSPISSSALVSYQNDPQMLPPQFGFQAKVDSRMDRRFWQFYIKNWCPGRSVLKKTNLWLNDFASMHEREGVRAAMQCLAGVYIYDYVPQAKISRRVNELFRIAENRLAELLNDPEAGEKEAQELVTITTLLSMQDIILTERRLEKPYHPRWLTGFLEGENALQRTDPGARFWNKNNIQLDSLRIAQSIMVGRAVILAQPMMPLTSPTDFDPQAESSRFGWLLYGTEKEMYEIHGGCGFSKKLLHVVSQITYCAARLHQEPESPITPMTVQFLFQELQEMRQWSSESRTWDSAKQGQQVIEWVQSRPDDFVINNSADMTDVTAEAWRIAVIVYLQCRGLRLPRNHPDVIANLDALARCIQIMPTSGSNFTAQAPLFPVFLLGLLSTVYKHKEVSREWFEKVVKTPVRSSVPPLFQALERIWTWIDKDVPLDNKDTPESVSARDHWWEKLVSRVHEKEPETLCLT